MTHRLSTLRTPARRWAAAGLLAAASLGAAASPCADGNQTPASQPARSPLLKPWVINGLAATAVRLHDGQRWLELAVDSVGTASRVLGTPAAMLHSPQSGVVLLSCAAFELRQVAAAPSARSLSAPLW